MEIESSMLTPRVLSKAIIDYDSLPIKCCFRLSTEDLIKVCKEIWTKRYLFGAPIDHNKAPVLDITPSVRLAKGNLECKPLPKNASHFPQQ